MWQLTNKKRVPKDVLCCPNNVLWSAGRLACSWPRGAVTVQRVIAVHEAASFRAGGQ